MDRSGMWNMFVSPVRVKFNKRGGHMFTSAQTPLQCWVTEYLSVGDFKQIGNICNDNVTRERCC